MVMQIQFYENYAYRNKTFQLNYKLNGILMCSICGKLTKLLNMFFQSIVLFLWWYACQVHAVISAVLCGLKPIGLQWNKNKKICWVCEYIISNDHNEENAILQDYWKILHFIALTIRWLLASSSRYNLLVSIKLNYVHIDINTEVILNERWLVNH